MQTAGLESRCSCHGESSVRTGSASLFWTERVSWPLGLHCAISQSTVLLFNPGLFLMKMLVGTLGIMGYFPAEKSSKCFV